MQEAFLVFITKISLYPTIIFTGLVMFVTLYWVVSLLGMADMDSVDLGESGGDADVSTLSSTGFFTGLMLKFGLYGVPLIIILSLISLIGWLLSYLYTSLLHQYFDSGVLYYLFGTGALIFVLVVSMWLTGIIISPIRKNIAKIPKRNSSNNVGKIAVVRTLSVTDKHGEAELNDGGAGLILKIRSDTNDGLLKQGDRVMLIEYLDEANTYRVAVVEDKKIL
ncbi:MULTISPECIES: OB-fold-containig protein [Psychrobacter]|uniref:OB-fold-containig protein n=1 Tax=Psychrobacter TaxID=497 RepID=UPI00191862FC|nr:MULTISPECIES: OB-fold-containig protein [unclassified Psychrobacter]